MQRLGFCLVATALSILACKPPQKSEYISIGLDDFKSRPVAERLHIYRDIYTKSGHPRDRQLARHFTDVPDQTLRHLREELERSGDVKQFQVYKPILYHLKYQNDDDICANKDFVAIYVIIENMNLSSDNLHAYQIETIVCSDGFPS